MDTSPSQPPSHRIPPWILPTALVLVVGLGAWYALSRTGTATNSNNTNAVANTTNQPTSNENAIRNTNTTSTNVNLTSNTNTVLSDWLTYTDSTYAFSFRYPKDWRVTLLAPNSNLPGHPEQVWPGAISVRYPEAQEEILSFKALSGGYDAGLKWLNEHIGPFAATGQTTTIGGLAGRIVKPTSPGGNAFAIVEAPNFALIVLLDPTHPDFSAPATAALYQQILDSIRYTAS